MDLFNRILRMLRFIGLALGFSMSISNGVMRQALPGAPILPRIRCRAAPFAC